MAEILVTPTDTDIVVSVGENTTLALQAANDASGFADAAAASAAVSEQARDVAIAAGTQYPSEAAAVAALADGEFGSYLDTNGLPVYGQRVGSAMVPISGPWFGGERVGFQQSGAGAVARTAQSKNREFIHATDFGAVGDGVTDDTAAVQEAINEAIARGGGLVLLPPVTRMGAVALNGRCSLMGVEERTRITAVSGSYDMFTISASDVTIKNVDIDCAAKSGGWDFHIACGTNILVRIDIWNVRATSSRGFIRDSGTGSGGFHVVTRIIDAQTQGHRGPGILINRAFAYVWLIRTSIDYVGVADSNFVGFDLDLDTLPEGAGGIIMDDCIVLGSINTALNTGQHAFRIRNASRVWMLRTYADSCGGTGYIMDDLNAISGEGMICGLVAGDGMVLTNVVNSTFEALEVSGRNYLANPGTNRDGIRFVSGCANLMFSDLRTQSWGRHGVNKAGAQAGAIRIHGGFINNNGLAGVGYGINSTGNSALHVVGIGSNANAQGNYNLGGSFDFISVSQMASGAVVNVGPGPVTG